MAASLDAQTVQSFVHDTLGLKDLKPIARMLILAKSRS
jgi:hypothetical protein